MYACMYVCVYVCIYMLYGIVAGLIFKNAYLYAGLEPQEHLIEP